ncbi:MAG: hypothetical protein EZS28_030394, partial [Streblomastix strix]
MQDRFSSS